MRAPGVAVLAAVTVTVLLMCVTDPYPIGWMLVLLPWIALHVFWVWWSPDVSCTHCNGRQQFPGQTACRWCHGSGQQIRWQVRLVRACWRRHRERRARLAAAQARVEGGAR